MAPCSKASPPLADEPFDVWAAWRMKQEGRTFSQIAAFYGMARSVVYRKMMAIRKPATPTTAERLDALEKEMLRLSRKMQRLMELHGYGEP